MSDKTELKLEVGKFYKIEYEYSTKIMIAKLAYKNNEEYVFELNNSSIVVENKKNLFKFKITEHRELIKNSIVGWVNYSPNYAPKLECISHILTDLHTNDYIYESKEDAIGQVGDAAKQIYGRWTFEQLEEPIDE